MPETSERPVLEPGPDHPIEIGPSPERASVVVAGKTIADSERALVLREASYAPVLYFPAEDVDFSLLEATDHSSYCPYKGEAGYYSVPAGGERSVNAGWQYREPYSAVAEIAGHLAFYPDRVDSIG
jgi:uncharacterized protein (DUF427 family)